MNKPPPGQAPEEHDVDEEMVLSFLSQYQALDRALVRAGYTQASRIPGSMQADWAGFARRIEKQFDTDRSPVLQGAVSYLLWNDHYLARRNERIESSSPWEDPGLHNDIVWLSELVQQTGTRLIHDLNFPGGPGCDPGIVSAAWSILQAWSQLDPVVAQFLSDPRQ